MLIRVRIDLPFELSKRAQAEQLRDAILPLYQHASNINEGSVNQEIGYVEVENCRHDEGLPCEVIARWEVGKGKVI